jgi:hypothetical protein
VLEAAGKIPAGPIKFRGQDFATHEEALVAVLEMIDTGVQIDRLNEEDKQLGRLPPSVELNRLRRSAVVGFRRGLRSLTDENGDVLPAFRDAITHERDVPLATSKPEVERLFVMLGGDAADAPAAARRLAAETANSERLDDGMAWVRRMLERLDRAELAGLGSVTDVSLRIDDICVIWTEILGRRVGAVPLNGQFVRFAEACFVLLGEPRMKREAIRTAGRRWHAAGQTT